MEGNLTKQEKLERQERKVNLMMWVPIIVLLSIVPLIVRMLVIYPDQSVTDLLNSFTVYDVYSNFKQTAIIVLCVLMSVLLFLLVDKTKIKKDKFIKIYSIASGVFIGISLIATILSDYRSTAWWGMPDRAEGLVIWICYIFMMFYTLYCFRGYENFKFVIGAVSFLVVVSTIIGAFQYFGYDLFMNVEFFKNLILSEEAKQMGLELTSDFTEKKVFGTMYHYNYMGSFGAMMVPLFLTLTLFTKGKKKKVFLGGMTLCSMFLLFGSTSRAGIIGLVSAIVVGMIIFAKIIVKKWKHVVLIIGLIGCSLLGLNAITDGSIFSRVPTLISDLVGLLGGSDENFDYKDHIPVRDITHEDKKAKIIFQTGTLILSYIEDEFYFEDEQGNKVDYVLNDTGTYTTEDTRFNHIEFNHETVKVSGEQKAPIVISMKVNGLRTFFFMVTGEEEVVLCDAVPLKPIEIEYPEAIGFKGKEKVGSARGYIWSRSIPMMKKTLLIGNGPDTYALEFPQRDYLGKWWAYNTPNMIVDKAHNLYLSIFINHGGLALLSFLMMLGAYIIQSFRLYAFKGFYEASDIKGVAVTLAIIGYLGAGIFNDSVISVAPIFWILLGVGMAINYLIDKERINDKINKVIRLKR